MCRRSIRPNRIWHCFHKFYNLLQWTQCYLQNQALHNSVPAIWVEAEWMSTTATQWWLYSWYSYIQLLMRHLFIYLFIYLCVAQDEVESIWCNFRMVPIILNDQNVSMTKSSKNMAYKNVSRGSICSRLGVRLGVNCPSDWIWFKPMWNIKNSFKTDLIIKFHIWFIFKNSQQKIHSFFS